MRQKPFATGTVQMLDNFLQIYGNDLENKLENGDRVLEGLISAFVLVRYIRKAILTPMTHMKENMEKIFIK